MGLRVLVLGIRLANARMTDEGLDTCMRLFWFMNMRLQGMQYG